MVEHSLGFSRYPRRRFASSGGDALVNVRLKEPTGVELETAAVLALDLRWLTTPAQNEPPQSKPGETQSASDEALIADWNRFVGAWRCIVELAYAESLIITADVRRFDFSRIVRSGGGGSGALEQALVPCTDISATANALGRPTWDLPTVEGANGLSKVALALVEHAAAVAQRGSDARITTDDLITIIRRRLSGIISPVPAWLSLVDSRAEISVPLTLSQAYRDRKLRLSDVCTLLQLALVIKRSPGLAAPSTVPIQMVAGTPPDSRSIQMVDRAIAGGVIRLTEL